MTRSTDSTETPPGTLPVLIAQLAQLRQQLVEARARADALREAFEREHREPLERARHLQVIVAQKEDEIRRLAVGEYERTGVKRVAPGVAIRTTIALEYDPATALEWARSHQEAGDLLSLDRRKFERVARALSLPFVAKRTVATVTIAKDLDAVLAPPDAEASAA